MSATQNKSQKRLLESPENIVSDPKLSKHICVEGRLMESQKMNNLQNQNTSVLPSLSNFNEGNLDERDIRMLTQFEKMIQYQFNIFSQTHISPMVAQLSEYKEENSKLREDVRSCVERIAILEKNIRESNLVFTNVPLTENHEKSIEDICKNLIKIGDTDIEKIIPIKENKQQNTVTILATFKSRRTTEVIMRKAGNLKGTKIGVSRDLSREERMARSILLKLRREILNTGVSIKVKVYGKHIIIDKEKLTFDNTSFGNSKVDGRSFVLEKFGISFDSILTNNQ